jgi:DNA repair protein RadC
MTYTTILNSNLEDRILINGTSSLNNIELITLLIGQCKSVKPSVLVAEDLLKLTGGDLYALGKLLPEASSKFMV